MGAFLIPVIIVLVFVVAAAAATVTMSRRRVALKEHLEGSEVSTVRYRVPPGQDPAAVVASLAKAGFDAVEYASSDEIVVPYGTDAERQRIEQVVREAPEGLAD